VSVERHTPNNEYLRCHGFRLIHGAMVAWTFSVNG
jgi:hypothetical protein